MSVDEMIALLFVTRKDKAALNKARKWLRKGLKTGRLRITSERVA